MKLHETSAFRLALRLAGLFSLIAISALSSVYLVTVQEFKAQIDRELILDIDELTTHYNQHGIESLIQHIQNRQYYGQHLHHYYAVSDLEFNHLSGNSFLIQTIQLEKKLSNALKLIDVFDVEHAEEDDDRLRIATKKLNDHYFLVTGQSNNSIKELKEHTFSAVFIAVIVSMLSALAIGIYMSRQVLSNIERINLGLENAIANNFSARLVVPEKEDEYHELTLKLNSILTRIENLLTGMRQVTDNIAHDLRSPLTRLRSRLEITLLQPRNEGEYKHVMEKAIDDCSNLLGTFNSLLSIAQAEAGVRGKEWRKIDITSLVKELAEMYQLVAEEKKLRFSWKKSQPIIIEGNRQLLAQAVSNLLENSIKYTPPNGLITLGVLLHNKAPIIEVSDSGPGIPDKNKAIALERFQRLDSARNSSGNGLGLSLVNAVAILHEATLTLSDNNPGLRVQLHFQKTAAHSHLPRSS